jgi:hypothetical protein
MLRRCITVEGVWYRMTQDEILNDESGQREDETGVTQRRSTVPKFVFRTEKKNTF